MFPTNTRNTYDDGVDVDGDDGDDDDGDDGDGDGDGADGDDDGDDVDGEDNDNNDEDTLEDDDNEPWVTHILLSLSTSRDNSQRLAGGQICEKWWLL